MQCINLLTNACKYTIRGHIRLDVSVVTGSQLPSTRLHQHAADGTGTLDGTRGEEEGANTVDGGESNIGLKYDGDGDAGGSNASRGGGLTNGGSGGDRVSGTDGVDWRMHRSSFPSTRVIPVEPEREQATSYRDQTGGNRGERGTGAGEEGCGRQDVQRSGGRIESRSGRDRGGSRGDSLVDDSRSSLKHCSSTASRPPDECVLYDDVRSASAIVYTGIERCTPPAAVATDRFIFFGVRDTGIGVADTAKRKLFQAFTQVQTMQSTGEAWLRHVGRNTSIADFVDAYQNGGIGRV